MNIPFSFSLLSLFRFTSRNIKLFNTVHRSNVASFTLQASTIFRRSINSSKPRTPCNYVLEVTPCQLWARAQYAEIQNKECNNEKFKKFSKSKEIKFNVKSKKARKRDFLFSYVCHSSFFVEKLSLNCPALIYFHLNIVNFVMTHFASRVSAIIPEAIAAAAELPPNFNSHCLFLPIVTYNKDVKVRIVVSRQRVSSVILTAGLKSNAKLIKSSRRILSLSFFLFTFPQLMFICLILSNLQRRLNTTFYFALKS